MPALLNELSKPQVPPTYALTAMDALRALEFGQVVPAIILAASSLESSIDEWISRDDRVGSKTPESIAKAMNYTGKRQLEKLRTVEDVLKSAGLSLKLRYCSGFDTTLARCYEHLDQAIDLRNLVVHTGVQVPPEVARDHVEVICGFVLNHAEPMLSKPTLSLSLTHFEYAYREGAGRPCSENLLGVVSDHAVSLGKTLRLHNAEMQKSSDKHDIFEVRDLGESVVIWAPFAAIRTVDQLELRIARGLVYHDLVLRRLMPRAFAAEMLPN